MLQGLTEIAHSRNAEALIGTARREGMCEVSEETGIIYRIETKYFYPLICDHTDKETKSVLVNIPFRSNERSIQDNLSLDKEVYKFLILLGLTLRVAGLNQDKVEIILGGFQRATPIIERHAGNAGNEVTFGD